MSDSGFQIDLNSLEPYVLGKKTTGPVKKSLSISGGSAGRLNKQLLEDFLTMLEEDQIAKQMFEAYEYAKDFYASMIDFANLFPPEQYEELFYAAKLGGVVYREIPSPCVYMLKKCWEAANGIPNLIMKIVPRNYLKLFFTEGYFLGGLTLQYVVRNVCTELYTPLSVHRLKNRFDDFSEIYVVNTDMVAAVPNDIADRLTDDAILQIEMTPAGLSTGGVLIRTMCNRFGAINSHYDLRGLL